MYIATILGFAVSLASSAMRTSGTPAVTLHEAGVTKIKALVAIARLTKAPLGIVLGKNSELCKDVIVQLDVDRTTVSDALGKVVSGASYHIESHGDVVDVVPDDANDVAMQLLSQRLGAFSPQPAPMHVLGVIFDGWLEMAMHPGSGWSGEIPSSTSAIVIKVSTGHDATAKDVLTP